MAVLKTLGYSKLTILEVMYDDTEVISELQNKVFELHDGIEIEISSFCPIISTDQHGVTHFAFQGRANVRLTWAEAWRSKNFHVHCICEIEVTENSRFNILYRGKKHVYDDCAELVVFVNNKDNEKY